MSYELIVLRAGCYTEAPGSKVDLGGGGVTSELAGIARLSVGKRFRDGYNAACTITLLKGRRNILVDTGSAWDSQLLSHSLRQNGLATTDIDYVIGTHGHCDHVGNLNMFTNATHIVCHDVFKDNVYYEHPFHLNVPYEIDNEVSVESTPGHTSQDISVFVQTASHGLVAISGDIFESEHDLVDPELWQSSSQFPEIQQKSRLEILKRADSVVPGHGPMFVIPKSFKEAPYMVMIASYVEEIVSADIVSADTVSDN